MIGYRQVVDYLEEKAASKEITKENTAEEYWNTITAFLDYAGFSSPGFIKPKFSLFNQLEKVKHKHLYFDIPTIANLEKKVEKEVKIIINNKKITIRNNQIAYRQENPQHAQRLNSLFLLWFVLHTGCRTTEAINFLHLQQKPIDPCAHPFQYSGYSAVWIIELAAKYTKTEDK